jgi:hypothetical protein
MAYYNMEPFGPRMDLYRGALVSSVLANVNRGKRGKAYSPRDFMPRHPLDQGPKQSVAEMRDRLKAMHQISRSASRDKQRKRRAAKKKKERENG